MSFTTRIKSGYARHSYALAAAVVVLPGFVWMVTYGSFDLFDRQPFGQFYDAQASSLLAGHWDVPPRAIFLEGFYRDGKAYGYFGFVPALPRMALNYFFPAMSGSWSRISVTIAAAATLFFCYRLLLRARRWVVAPAQKLAPNPAAYGGFLLLAGLGSSTIYLGSCAFIYHEAIIWAVALSLACYDQLIGYQIDARSPRLIAACALAYFCFFCRISTGCGPFLTLVLLGLNIVAWRLPKVPGMGLFRRLSGGLTPPPLAHAAIVSATLIAIVAMYVAVNHAKFGTFFEAAPMRLHEQVFNEPGRFERTDGKWMRLSNIPTVAYAYFSPDNILFGRKFPWVYLQPYMHRFPAARMEGNEPFASVTASMPAFVLLVLIGIVGLMRSIRSERNSQAPVPTSRGRAPPELVLIGSLGGIAPLLPFCDVDHRYLHDFLPFLILAGAFGLHTLLAMRPRRFKIILAIVLIMGGIFQIYVNCAFALVYQRLMVYCRPVGPEIEMRQWQRSIDEFVGS